MNFCQIHQKPISRSLTLVRAIFITEDGKRGVLRFKVKSKDTKRLAPQIRAALNNLSS